jgi:hypothetical protein
VLRAFFTAQKGELGGSTPEELGANTSNPPTDLTLAQIAAIRTAVAVALDI